MPDSGFVALNEALPRWPSNVVKRPAALNQVGLQEFDVISRDDPERLRLTGSLIWFQELVLELTAIPGFSIAFLHSGEATVVDFELDVVPEIELRLPSLDVDLRLDNPLLQPVERTNGSWEPKLDASGDPEPLVLSMTGIGLAGDLAGNVEITGSASFDLGALAVGDTGLVLELGGVQPVLSRDQTAPDGAPPGFRGLVVDSVVLYLPEGFAVDVAPDRIEGEELLIGADGFSGTIRGTWDAPAFDVGSGTFVDGEGVGTLFGIPFALREISLTLRQSTVAGSTITGSMVLPFFDQPVSVEVGLAEGGLTVGLAADQPEGVESEGGLVTFKKEGVLEATVGSIAFEASDGPFAVTIGGTITPLAGGVDWPGVEVDALTIDAEGNVDVEGGWIDLPEKYRVDFHGFGFEVTRLGLGNEGEGTRWLGLNGGLRLVEGLPAGASVEGLRITWDDDGLQGVSFDGVGLEFGIEGVLRFDGEVAYVRDGDDHRFDGAIDLDLVSLGLQIDARLVVGRRKGYTYFAVYVGADLPAGIPLFTTGLALYGMAGLYAQHMEPGKSEEQRWYSLDRPKSWYHQDEPGVGVLSKWAPRRGSMALGAGVTLGTASDDGYAFNGKLLLVVLLPGPVILLEGRANLMKKRAELDAGEPNFRTLAVLDNREGSFLFGLDAQYKFDEKEGRLVDIRAGAEAYYDFSDPTAWYCYLGKKAPPDQRISARVYSLFEATGYYMLDARGVELGARVGYDVSESVGPLSVEVEAWLEAAAALSWMPPHFFGELLLHGAVRLKAFGVGLGLSVDARVAADVFDPFHLVGTFSVALETPPLLPDPSADITLEWGPIPEPPPLPLPLKGIAVEHLKTSAKWPLPREGTDGALLRPDYDADGTGYRTEPRGSGDPPPSDDLPVVPVDGRPHLTFAQSVRDAAGVGVNPATVGWTRIGDPKEGEGPVKTRASLTRLVLEKARRNGWSAVAESPASDGVPTLFGSWAPTPPLPLDDPAAGDDVQHAPVKLWLWSRNPFAWAVHAGREWEDWFLGENAAFPCVEVPEQGTDVYDVEEVSDPDIRPDILQEGTKRSWTSPDGVTYRWDERAFEIIREGRLTLRRGDREVSSSTDWMRGDPSFREGVPHSVLERSVLRLGRSPERHVVEAVVDADTLRIRDPYRLLLRDGETHSEYAFHVDPRIETLPWQPFLRGSTLDVELTRIVSADRDLARLSPLIPELPSFLRGPRVLTFDFEPELVSPDALDLPFVLTLELPRDHARVAVELDTGPVGSTEITVLGFDRDGLLRAWNSASTPEEGGELTVFVEDEAQGGALRSLRLHVPEPGKTLRVLRVIGTDVPQEVIDERRRMADHLQQETRRWEQSGTVLEPNSTYRLRVETEIEARGEDELAGYEETLKQTEFAYFRTGGPPGVPAVRDDGSSMAGLSVPPGHANPSKFSSGLDDLGAYVEETVPPTLSGDGGKRSEPSPVYRAYDVGVRFDEDYVELMYRQARRDLGLYLFDANDRPVRDNRGRILPANNRWGNTEELGLSDRDARWIETLEERDCVSVSRERIPRPSTLTARDRGQLLRPGARYEARLVPMLLHETFHDLLFHGWEPVHGGSGGWSLDRSTNVRAPVDRVEGPVVHLGGGSDLSQVRAGLHLVFFDPSTTGLRPAYRILAVDPGSDTVTLDGRPDLLSDRSYTCEFTQPGGVRHTASVTGSGGDPLRRGALVARGESGWSNYRLSAYVRTEVAGSTPDPTGSIGVAFRRTGDRYYRFALHARPEVIRLTRVDDSTATVLAEDEGVAYDAGRDYHLAVEAVGDRIRAYRDGRLVFDVTDDGLDAGEVGLYAWKNDRAVFRDVRVDDLGGSADPAYRFSFVTSRYAHFRHHLHSYQDETWPGSVDADAVSRADLGALAAPAVVQADVYDPPADGETSAYDALADHVLGPQSHAFPERLEVTRVQHDGAAVALLVRSPEPIDWSRTALRVHRAPGDRVTSSLPGRVKIIGAHFGRGVDEGLDLLIRETSSLDGVRVESRRHTPGVVATDLPGSDDEFDGLLLDVPFEKPLGEDWAVVDQAPYSSRSSRWLVRDGELWQRENYYGFVGGMVNAPGTYVHTGSPDWTDYRVDVRLRSDDDDAIGVLFRYTDRDNYYRFSMDRQRGYRRLIRKLDGTVTVLWEDDETYRTGRSYDFRIDCVGDRLEASLDGDPLFVVTDDAHPAGGVGLYCRANDAARFEHLRVLAPTGEWTPYHTFDDATEWADGTVVRLHSAPPSGSTGAGEHVPADAAPDQGRAFWPHGTEVRVVAPDGSILHQRHLADAARAGFSSTDLHLLRRADGTAFVLLRRTAGVGIEPLDPGTYRLAFRFRRNNRTHDPESVVLRQSGSDAAERTTLDIPWNTLVVNEASSS